MILICDDDPTVRTTLTLVLKRAGYQVATASTPKEAIDFVRKTTPRLILMDMNYSNTTTGEEGLELLARVRVFCPNVPVILITAWGSIHLAVKGIRTGAFDFITKPWNNLTLLNSIRTAIELTSEAEAEKEEKSAADSNTAGARYKNIIGRSPLLIQLLNTISRVAKTSAPILITGESGTGKELIAEAIHQESDRYWKPFVKVNLGGISQSLFESEMFGHVKGAFTDARHNRTGRFEMANHGTIFLDEIGDLDQTCQVKLLRVLQDQTFEALGDSKPRQVDTRIISATNKNLPEMVTKGAFREDLFYRINLITLHMPALRERIEDIPLLIEYFADRQTEIIRQAPVEFSADAIAFLQRLPYPGNIRELKNLIERTILVSTSSIITEKVLKEQYIEIPLSPDDTAPAVQSLHKLEKEMIRRAIKLYGNNHSRIASALGLTRQALYRRLEKYNIELPD